MPLLRRSIRSLPFSQQILSRSSHWGPIRDLRLRNAPVDIHPEVEDALAHNRPVVSLETALVTHGLPYPQSLDVPLALEEVVRSEGSVPATIGVVGGRIKIGLERDELERLANRRGKPEKVSRRDIAAAIATEKDGGTTCSATLVFSALAGIKVFATGGLGGVHRGGQSTMDVSADLGELTRCPVGLVSSGVKSILDIGRTLEYLETLGVPVVSYSETNDFPAFFSPTSGHKVPWNVDDPMTAAKILRTQWELGMNNGVLFAAPIPDEYRTVGDEIQQLVDQAVRESEENGVSLSGKDATPWLLNRVSELSKGKSLLSNVALLKNNALIGSQIAVQYARLKEISGGLSTSKGVGHQPSIPSKTGPFSKSSSTSNQVPPHQGSANVVVVGSSALDVTARANKNINPSLAPHSTIPGSVKLTVGGVARNIAEAATRVTSSAYPGVSSLLIAPVGEDIFGHVLAGEISRLGMRDDGLVKARTGRTAVCNMILDSEGALIGGIADMDITNNFTPDVIIPKLQSQSPDFVAFDGNLTPETMKVLVNYSETHDAKVLYEPTSVFKSTRILPTIASYLKENDPTKPLIAHFTPNILELIEVYGQARSEEFDLMSQRWWWDNINSLSLGSSFRLDIDQLARKFVDDENPSEGTLGFLTEEGIAQMAVHLLPFFQHIWIKCGSKGVVAVMQIPEKDAQAGFARERTNIVKRCIVAHGKNGEVLVLKHFPALEIDALVNVTGAGDSFVGALLAGLAHDAKRLYDPKGLDGLVNTAQKAAVLTLQSHEAVSPLLSNLIKM